MHACWCSVERYMVLPSTFLLLIFRHSCILRANDGFTVLRSRYSRTHDGKKQVKIVTGRVSQKYIDN